MKIEWMETLDLGVPELDGDHKTMVAIMQAIERTAEKHQKKECVALLERLFSFTRHHFQREEILLKTWGYGEVAGHARYHEELMDGASRVMKTCIEQDNTEDFARCCDELMRFLIDDVVRGDLNLKSFLDYNGISIAN